MSSGLFHAGLRRAPRTAARRIVWGVVTLVPLGAIAACFTVVAVLGWFGEIAQTDAERMSFTVFAVIFDLIFVLTLVFGAVEVTRQFARERAPASGEER
ncbi:hypothetical protein GCM10009651_22570 [Microbacterium natoriense]|uniref:hypothetical protein n=1 Tax=Microbacterium natoriense TaxID=284570 RepID=UPI0031D891E0